MDFMHDGLTNGVKIRAFNIIDDFNREALNITIDTSLTSMRVIRELDRLIAWRGAPERIRVEMDRSLLQPQWISGRRNEESCEVGRKNWTSN